jgi:hypothetical protein
MGIAMDMRKRIRNLDPIMAITVILVIAAIIALGLAIGSSGPAG